MLPDDALLEIFDFYVDEDFKSLKIQVDNASTRVSTLEKCHFSSTPSPQSATPLYTPNTCEGHPGNLTAIASHHLRLG